MNKSPSPVNFREDINGLRAWAVVAVLLYHFKIFGITGGFVGVDIFFVISGFLMTAIIVKGLERQDFSIWAFYLARARRIFPALTAMIIALLILGWFWLPSPNYMTLGHQSSYALAFISNIYFRNKTGYFDAEAHEQWLLHTWSLSIEWQFYLCFPIFVMLLWKIRPGLQALACGLGVIFIISLALSGFSDPSNAFYSLSTRGWELTAGGFVFLNTRFQFISNNHKPLINWLGWALVIGSITLISSGSTWHALWLLLPVAGTAMIMTAQQPGSRFISNHVAQWLGYRSYSLYIWHWPFVVALHLTGLNQKWIWVLAAITSSLILAHLSYQLIEAPTRRYLSNKSQQREGFITFSSMALILAMALIIKNHDFNRPIPLEAQIAANEAFNKDPRLSKCFHGAKKNGSPGCIYGSNKVGAILVGDSHAASVATAFGVTAKMFHKGVIQLSYSGCQPLVDAKTVKPKTGEINTQCMEIYDSVISKIKTFKNNIPVIIVSRLNVAIWGNNESFKKQNPKVFFSKIYLDGNNPIYQKEFIESHKKLVCNIAARRQVFLIRPIPEIGVNVPNKLSLEIVLSKSNNDIKIPIEDYHKRNRFVWNLQDEVSRECGAKILNPLPFLCNDQYCYGSKNGRPLYFDDDHLSEHGNRLLIPMFEQVFK